MRELAFLPRFDKKVLGNYTLEGALVWAHTRANG